VSGRTRFDLVINLATAKALVEGAHYTTFRRRINGDLSSRDDAAAKLCLRILLRPPLSLGGIRVFNVRVGIAELHHSASGRDHCADGAGAKLVSEDQTPTRATTRSASENWRRTLGFATRWTIEQE